MATIFSLEPWLWQSLARVAESQRKVAFIGLRTPGAEAPDGLTEASGDPAQALARLRALPAGQDEAGNPRRPLQLAVVGADSTHHASAAMSALLAWLRDIGAEETWVLLAGDEAQWPARLQALGFTDAPIEGEQAGQHCRRFCFAIRSYKPTPDWLGPRNWANPELFGLFRW